VSESKVALPRTGPFRVHGLPTVMPVPVDRVRAPDGDVVEQAEAVAAVRVALGRNHPQRPRVVPRRPHRAKSIARLPAARRKPHEGALAQI
jgi:hypothetical protein